MIYFTVAPYRYTPDAEFERLADMVLPVLDDVRVWRPEPLPWTEFVRGLDERKKKLEKGDILVGFDLPHGIARSWIDIREHPIHFTGEQFWSVTSSLRAIDEAVAEQQAEIPEQKRLAEYTSVGAFAAQVSFDQALMRDGSIIRPADVMEGLRAFAHRFEALYVCPSPKEPNGPWVDAALEIPNAIRSPWPTYDTLRRVRNVCTVTSSVGVEAEYFGCETTWLAEKQPYSPPVRDLAAVLEAALVAA